MRGRKTGMSLVVKICGINSPDAMTAAIDGGADYVGLMFYPPSPRFLDLGKAAELAAIVPVPVRRTGVFVDAPDEVIAKTLEAVPMEALQLHGAESPEQVARTRERFGLTTIKAVRVAAREDLETARAYDGIADIILFDAKPPASMTDALPGGNALSFDWTLLAGWKGRTPWMLSGGLDAGNLAEAVKTAGATAVDVSSGVEPAPGVKDPARIRTFLDAARNL
jgi:phosphoribosylanthranilate isomerase